MNTAKWIVVVAVCHFVLTTASVLGATLISANALRSGVEQLSLAGELITGVASILGQPVATAILTALPKDTAWLWPVVGLNSLAWAVVVVFIILVTRRSRNEHT